MQEAVAYNVKGRARFRNLADRKGFLGTLFLLPAVVYIVALVGIPFFFAIAFSLSDVTVGDTSLNFVGLENFRSIIKTSQFQRALGNSFLFVIVAQVLIIVLATTLAQVLSQDFRGKWLVRFLIILPWAAPISLGTIGWLWSSSSCSPRRCFQGTYTPCTPLFRATGSAYTRYLPSLVTRPSPLPA